MKGRVANVRMWGVVLAMDVRTMIGLEETILSIPVLVNDRHTGIYDRV